jgi:hypothetical protein
MMVSPMMLVGPKAGHSGPKEPPRSYRVIADNWRGLYGSDRFSSIWPLAAIGGPRNSAICANISVFAVFFHAGIATGFGAH